MPGTGLAGELRANTLILISLQSVATPPAWSMEGPEDLTHLPSDIQNYMRKLGELDPPIYLTRKTSPPLSSQDLHSDLQMRKLKTIKRLSWSMMWTAVEVSTFKVYIYIYSISTTIFTILQQQHSS